MTVQAVVDWFLRWYDSPATQHMGLQMCWRMDRQPGGVDHYSQERGTASRDE